jgi:hypothetical protein
MNGKLLFIMKTKNIFHKRVPTLSVILILFFVNSKLYSQIIYTDIPDATPNASYPLDLNNDNVVDFIIQFSGSAGTVGVMCNPQNNNAYSGNFVNGTYLPWALSTSNTICASLATWYDFNNPGTLALGTSIGYWVGASDKYLALKLIVGTNTYYGWARFDILANSGSFTIKDYAYESTPNVCIQSGQNNLGGNEISKNNNYTIFPNPFNTDTTIQTIDNFKNATLLIYNSYGQEVKQVNNLEGQSVSLLRDNLPVGLYYIKLTEKNKVIAAEKIIIKD